MGTYDLAISLEVAEHLTEKSGQRLVRLLTNLAPVVLFSAAIPGQGGKNHINEQWQSYWVELFAQEKYVCYDIFRGIFWNVKEISPWYRQNMFLFVSNSTRLDDAIEEIYSIPLNIIHPEIYGGFTRLVTTTDKELENELARRNQRK